MANTAAQTARNAEADTRNVYGMCLQQSRQWAGIPARYPDATTAWRHTNDRHPKNRNPPRGSAVYWTGGRKGYGHIGISLGNGIIRSTDAKGRGRVGNVTIAWVERNWNLPYAGWAWDINEVTIPHSGSKTPAKKKAPTKKAPAKKAAPKKDDEMNLNDSMTEWSPDEGLSKNKTTIHKTLNQARGYSEDTYEHVKALEAKVNGLDKKLNAIIAKLG
jgi:hypothetical protein